MESPLLYSAISAWATLAAVFCALLVMWSQNRSAKRLTCLQLFIQLAAQYDSSEMQKVRGRLASELLTTPDAVDLEDTLLVFYENLAILVRRRLLDPDLVGNTFSIDVRCYWLALRHYVAHNRTEYSDQTIFEEFEWLNKNFVCCKRSPLGTQQRPTAFTPEEIHRFLRDESRRGRTRAQ
ncbi:MAG: DUF4760 domain-containing protein [Panacagrimonas sp.]